MPKKHQIVDQFIKEAEELDERTPEAEARYQEYRGRRGKELELWKKWNEGGQKDQHLSPLLKSMKPLIRSEADKRLQGLGGSIPRSAIEGELTNAAVKAFQSYNPTRGTALSTHVVGNFRRITDFVNANRNAKYMPGGDVKRYQALQNATAELRDQLGRQPTPEELKPLLPGVSVRAIGRMQRGFGSELYTDLGDGLSTGGDDAPRQMHPRDAFFLVHSELNPQQQQFGAMYFPAEGEKQPTIKNIARTLNITPQRAYTLKAQVESKVGPKYRKQ